MKTTQHFNQLTEQESEALAILSEECAEVIQIIGKIQRHGLESFHPEDPNKTINAVLLAKELGHVVYAKDRLAKILKATESFGLMVNVSASNKAESIKKYLHHP